MDPRLGFIPISSPDVAPLPPDIVWSDDSDRTLTPARGLSPLEAADMYYYASSFFLGYEATLTSYNFYQEYEHDGVYHPPRVELVATETLRSTIAFAQRGGDDDWRYPVSPGRLIAYNRPMDTIPRNIWQFGWSFGTFVLWTKSSGAWRRVSDGVWPYLRLSAPDWTPSFPGVNAGRLRVYHWSAALGAFELAYTSRPRLSFGSVSASVAGPEYIDIDAPCVFTGAGRAAPKVFSTTVSPLSYSAYIGGPSNLPDLFVLSDPPLTDFSCRLIFMPPLWTDFREQHIEASGIRAYDPYFV